ncbi:pinin/SDK/memA/ protein conserved region-domain-containing protein [Ampelomyces quisqualis]|uniref:Pinin/SDK/memA/ protein conserved region-domain-containing protein n=1 Tax=Ampelomyces quisqualis TaxID=50730 RepID=A0A6A5QNM1_AMPQU|nr:pinin/SDK/memA/ protein conserved region-domain-containing protein [Ampelomyces quisqualis]
MDGPIASAVVLPEELLPPASPPGNKRRHPSLSGESAKRPRLDDTAPVGRRDPNGEVRTAAPVRRERGRERRLFGAVLGALSQAPSTTAAQKRRFEIEKRQLAQRKQENEESEQRNVERIARRKIQRWTEQKRFEEQSMRLQHQNLLATAQFLRTESLPHLYYKPWETSPEEENRIQTQIAEARQLIDQELEEYEARRKEEASRERRASRDHAEADRNAQDSYTGKKHGGQALPETSTPNGHADGSHNSPKDQDMKNDPAEEPAAEDTVIY